MASPSHLAVTRVVSIAAGGVVVAVILTVVYVVAVASIELILMAEQGVVAVVVTNPVPTEVLVDANGGLVIFAGEVLRRAKSVACKVVLSVLEMVVDLAKIAPPQLVASLLAASHLASTVAIVRLGGRWGSCAVASVQIVL